MAVRNFIMEVVVIELKVLSGFCSEYRLKIESEMKE